MTPSVTSIPAARTRARPPPRDARIGVADADDQPGDAARGDQRRAGRRASLVVARLQRAVERRARGRACPRRGAPRPRRDRCPPRGARRARRFGRSGRRRRRPADSARADRNPGGEAKGLGHEPPVVVSLLVFHRVLERGDGPKAGRRQVRARTGTRPSRPQLLPSRLSLSAPEFHRVVPLRARGLYRRWGLAPRPEVVADSRYRRGATRVKPNGPPGPPALRRRAAARTLRPASSSLRPRQAGPAGFGKPERRNSAARARRGSPPDSRPGSRSSGGT